MSGEAEGRRSRVAGRELAGVPARASEAFPPRKILATAARSLTIFRAVAIAPFVALLASVSPQSSASTTVVVLYLAVILSDFLDGRLARAAGTATARGARLDAAADIAFNLSSLTAAAWLGLIGAWVPAGVALLGSRFLLRLRRESDRAPGGIADGAGKLAGVLYYGLVGLVVAERAAGMPGAASLALAADLVFLYTLFAWWIGRGSANSSA